MACENVNIGEAPCGQCLYCFRDRIGWLESELAAYKKAKSENDDRFMRERDEARAERDAALKRVEELEAVRCLNIEPDAKTCAHRELLLKRASEAEAAGAVLEGRIIAAMDTIRENVTEAATITTIREAPGFASRVQAPMLALNEAIQTLPASILAHVERVKKLERVAEAAMRWQKGHAEAWVELDVALAALDEKAGEG